MRFQFTTDGRAAAPLRETWAEAAQDAVSAGFAIWVTAAKAAIKLDNTAGGDIRRVR